MPELRSVEPALLSNTAAFVAEDIAFVLINDTVKVTEFRSKSVVGNSASVEYEVNPSMTSLVTSIKLMKDDNTVLTQAAVYVPVTQPVYSKHTITVKEGV